MELTNFLEKIQSLQLQIQVATSCRTMCNFLFLKIIKMQDFMDKTNFFGGTLPFSSWAILATWLHLEVPQKLQEK